MAEDTEDEEEDLDEGCEEEEDDENEDEGSWTDLLEASKFLLWTFQRLYAGHTSTNVLGLVAEAGCKVWQCPVCTTTLLQGLYWSNGDNVAETQVNGYSFLHILAAMRERDQVRDEDVCHIIDVLQSSSSATASRVMEQRSPEGLLPETHMRKASVGAATYVRLARIEQLRHSTLNAGAGSQQLK